MPIFVSRFSAERIASAGLARVRDQGQSDRRERLRETERGDRAERSERGRAARENERAQDQLPVATQQAESIRDRVRNRIAVAAGGSETEEAQTTRPDLPTEPTLPGVRTVTDSTTTRASSQVGRLDQTDAPSVRRSRFASQATPSNARAAEVRQAFQNIPSEAQNFEALQANRLNTQIDATIRLLRSRNEERPTVEPETQPEIDTPAQVDTPVQVETPTVVERPEVPGPEEVAAAESPPEETAATAVEDGAQSFPNAEQISRANTTEEIQANLRSDSAEIEQGLRADAEIQAQQNQRQTAANAARSSEASRESQIEDNEEQVRDLSQQERQLEQSLRATQNEIRDLNNENNRLESAGSTPSPASAANLATQV